MYTVGMAKTNDVQFELHLLAKLVKPSYLSGTIAALSTLLIVGSALISKAYLSSGWLADTLKTIASSDNQLFKNRTGSGDSPINVVLLFMFWAGIGLAVYFLVIGIAHAANEAKELEQEMNFVHSNKQAIIHNFVQKLAARLTGLVLLFGTVSLYLKMLVPHSLETIHDTTNQPKSILTAVLITLALLLVVHLIAVLLRVIALRPRLFSAEID